MISVVVPVYNESKNIPALYKRLKEVLPKIAKDYEVIFIDDGSTDASRPAIKRLRQKDKKVKTISFSRNFGHMAAVSAGLKHASGDKVVIMDADLQDPPEVILKMYQKATQGYEVVYGIKSKRKEGATKKLMFSLFYRLLDKITRLKMPLDAGAFSLIDRKVVSVINSLPERNRYFSGLRVWAGFTQVGVKYERPARSSGRPSSFLKLTKLAIDGLVSFSYLPLRISSILGFVFAAIAFIFIGIVIFARLALGSGIIGWASTLSVILLIGGIQLITLGIIGEYLARIYDEVKNRPEYIVAEKQGFRKKS